MKCPQCGAWNQAYLPKCNRCGAPLHQDASSRGVASWEEDMHKKKPALQVISFEAGEKNTPIPEGDAAYDPEAVDRAVLTDELEELQRRREAGANRIRQMKEQAESMRRAVREAEIIRPAAEPDDLLYAEDSAAAARRRQLAQKAYLDRSAAAGDDAREEPNGYFGNPSYERPLAYVEDESAPVFYDGYTPDPGEQAALTDKDYMPRRIQTRASDLEYEDYSSGARKKKSALHLLGRFALILVCCFAVGAGGVFAARRFILQQGMQVREDNETRVEVTQGQTDDGHPSHRLTIYGRENATVFLNEMQSSYVIADGKVDVDIPDYMWYDTEQSTYARPVETDTMDVVITPYIRYSQEGDQYQLDPVEYTVDVPLSPIYLLNPPTAIADVSVSIFEIRINVTLGSTVVIDGTNVSTLIRETGNVSKNVEVMPVGRNTISISVKSPYCRENKMEVVLNREPQDIPLELAATVMAEWNYEYGDEKNIPSINGTTLPGATVTVEFPHNNLQVNPETGAFSFEPIFTKLGDNEITIRASMEGHADSVITHTVYYMPNWDIYTRRAWSLVDGYTDLINYIDLRKGTIYTGTGVIERIISTAPQLAVMNLSDESAAIDRKVLIENSSKTTWEVGKTYRVYGDVYGLYDTMPRLTVRYTFLEE